MRDQPNGGASRRLTKTKTPGIYKRGNRYVVVWRYKGRQHKEYFESLEEAREAKGRRMGRERRKPTRVRVREYAPRWIESYRGRTARGFDESTRREYRREVEERILPYFGGYYLDQIDAGDVREWFTWLEERGCSAAGVRKAKGALSPMLADAKEERLTAHNPVSGVRYVPRKEEKPREKPRALRREELDAFFAALPEHWRLFFVLLAHSGMRVGEALGLTWRNVHRG